MDIFDRELFLLIHRVQKRSGYFAVYELKWIFVQEHGLYIKTAAILAALGLNIISETFQMRYYVTLKFPSRGIRNTKDQIWNFLKSVFLWSKFKSLEVWPLVFLMPLEENFNVVPHLKGLINGIETLC